VEGVKGEKTARDDPVGIDQPFLKKRWKGQLVKEEGDVGEYQHRVDSRPSAVRNSIADRDHWYTEGECNIRKNLFQVSRVAFFLLFF